MKRCFWCNMKNPKYIEYHDSEWGRVNFDDGYIFEMILLESFQAGLSWECVLNKRESFREAYDGFDLDKVCAYNEQKMLELQENKAIIRNKRKIKASINNSKIFREIVGEYGSFYKYLRTFTKDEIIAGLFGLGVLLPYYVFLWIFRNKLKEGLVIKISTKTNL